MWARRSVTPSNENRAIESALAAILRLLNGAVEVAPERRAGEQPGVGIDHAFGLERFQRALEARLERLQPHERQHAVDQAHRIAFDAHQVGQPFVVDTRIVEHADRQVAKARVLGQHRQQRLDHAVAQPLADHHAVDVAGVEIARSGFDAKRPDQAHALADRDRERRIGAAAPDAQHGGVVEQVERGRTRKRDLGLGADARAAARPRASTAPAAPSAAAPAAARTARRRRPPGQWGWGARRPPARAPAPASPGHDGSRCIV